MWQCCWVDNFQPILSFPTLNLKQQKMVSFDPAVAKLDFILLDQNVLKQKNKKAKLYIQLVSVHKWQSKNVIAVSRV